MRKTIPIILVLILLLGIFSSVPLVSGLHINVNKYSPTSDVSTQWTDIYNGAGKHYITVSDQNNGTELKTNQNAYTDLFDMANPSVTNPGKIYNVTVYALTAEGGTGSKGVKFQIKDSVSGNSQTTGALICTTPNGVGWQNINYSFTTNPNGGAWTMTNITNLRVGLISYITDPGNALIYVTELYVKAFWSNLTYNINLVYEQTSQFWQNMTFRKSGSYSGTSYALANDSTYVYMAGGNGVPGGTVGKYWQTNMTLKASTSSYGYDIHAIAIDSDYVYVGGDNLQKVNQYWKSNMTYKAQTASYSGNIHAIVVDGTYIYVGGLTTDKVYQYWKSNLTYKAQTASYGGDIYAIVQDSTYIYVAGSATDAINQYWKSNLTYKAQTASYGGTIRAMVIDSTYIYVDGLTTDEVYQYWISNLTKKANTASFTQPLLALAIDDTYVYAGGHSVNKIYQYWKSNLTKKAEASSGEVYTMLTTAFTDNPPIYGTPSPTNGSTGQDTSLTWNIPINDEDGNTINWNIACSNGQSSSATGASNGTKSLSISGLGYSTTYKVWVNTTDVWNIATKNWYTFVTKASIVNISVSPKSINLGTVNVGQSSQSSGYHFNLSNMGNVALSVKINASASQNWTFVSWANHGKDKFCMNFSKNNWATQTNVQNDGTIVLVSNLAVSGYQLFDIKAILPTSLSHTSNSEHFTVTLTATAI